MTALRLKALVAFFLPFLFIFLGSIYQPFDPDLGWHLRYGEYFFQHGQILRDNTFATDMPSYQWVNLSWGTDVLDYLFFNLGGFFGLSLASALVVALTFYFFAKAFELDFFEKAVIYPVILFLIRPVISVSFKGQLVSILFLGILTYLMLSYERGNRKIGFLIPLLFLFWANLHGQFVIGLGLFCIWAGSFVMRVFLDEKRKYEAILPNIKSLFLLLVLSVLGTLVNPFGFGLYQETAQYLHNPLLKSVAEYGSPEQLSRVWWQHILVGVTFCIGVAMLFFQKRLKRAITITGIFSVLYIFSFMIRRYSWSMYYFIMPFLKPIAAFVKPEKKVTQFWSATVIFLLLISLVLYLKVPWSQYQVMSWDIYCEKYMDCSPRAAEFLKEMPDKGHLMTFYNWGGWLIWQYPEIKPSIDGRMHLWKDQDGSAFEKYYAYEQNIKDIDTSDYDTVFMARFKPVYRRLLTLAKQGAWKMVYQDETTAIFTRVK